MKRRIIAWVLCLIVSVAYIGINKYVENLPEKDSASTVKKEELIIYNDVESESVVKKAFDNTSLSSSYKLEFESEPSEDTWNITKNLSLLSNNNDDDDEDDEENKDNNSDTVLTSFTPLIIGMKNSKSLQEYAENGLLISTEEINNSVEDEISIDFKKIIDAVVDGENWSLFGGENKEIKIFVPKEDTIEGKIFYNFLLVTINNGNYPENEETLKTVKETANSFLKSSNCVKVENVINELNNISSINATDIYVLFEADFMNSTVWSQKKLDISLAYPNTTLVKHIYTKASENEFEELSTFFYSLSEELNYRTSSIHSFEEDSNYNVKDDIEFIEVELEVEVEDDDIGTIFIIILVVLVAVLLILVTLVNVFGY